MNRSRSGELAVADAADAVAPDATLAELVVARYREDLGWLRNVPPALRVTVYDKSGEDEPSNRSADGPAPADRPCGAVAPNATLKRIALPNVGREAHTYLHHLVTHYDTLAERSVFCQGKPFDHAYDVHQTLRSLVANTASFDPFQWLGHIIDTDDATGKLFRSWSKNEDGRPLDLAGFHRQLFDSEGPATYPFVLGAQFIVHRDVVRSRPRAFYERALALSTTFPDAAHCFERTWDRVFGQVGIDPVWLAGRETVYLKPVKRLVG